MLVSTTLSTEGRSRLGVIHKQLSLKSELLFGLNQEIISLCEVSDIESEIEEAETITARIIECQSKIEKSIKFIVEAGHSSRDLSTVPSAPREPVELGDTLHANTRLPKLELV